MGESGFLKGGGKEEERIPSPPFSFGGGGEEKTVFLSITTQPASGRKRGERIERRDCLQEQTDSVKIEVQKMESNISSTNPPLLRRRRRNANSK